MSAIGVEAERGEVPSSGFGDRLFEELRVLVVAGVPVGVLVIGVGSRLAMFLLRLTSPDRVNGIRSDDDFLIGRFTLGGTYNLLMLGAAVGIVARRCLPAGRAAGCSARCGSGG